MELIQGFVMAQCNYSYVYINSEYAAVTLFIKRISLYAISHTCGLVVGA